MASYFDEHNCNPLRPGETPNHYLQFLRLLLTGGYWEDMQLEYSTMFGDKPPPPTSKEFIENLTTEIIANKGDFPQCPVCLKDGAENDKVNQLPCKHRFHSTCILPWLSKTNSCPVCRHELPTDDEDYEEFRKQKKRKKEREQDLETLHNSMFS